MPRPAFKLIWPLAFYKVSGESMVPTYHPGDILVGVRWRRPRQGDVVVATSGRKLIKRVTKRDSEGYWLEGDNAAASFDSRDFGYLGPASIEAIILARLMRSR